MNPIPLFLIAFLLVSAAGSLFGLRRIRPSSSARLLVGIVAILFLLSVAAGGFFGFLASFELPTPNARLPWQVGYGFLTTAALAVSGIAAMRAINVKHL